MLALALVIFGVLSPASGSAVEDAVPGVDDGQSRAETPRTDSGNCMLQTKSQVAAMPSDQGSPNESPGDPSGIAAGNGPSVPKRMRFAQNSMITQKIPAPSMDSTEFELLQEHESLQHVSDWAWIEMKTGSCSSCGTDDNVYCRGFKNHHGAADSLPWTFFGHRRRGFGDDDLYENWDNLDNTILDDFEHHRNTVSNTRINRRWRSALGGVVLKVDGTDGWRLDGAWLSWGISGPWAKLHPYMMKLKTTGIYTGRRRYLKAGRRRIYHVKWYKSRINYPVWVDSNCPASGNYGGVPCRYLVLLMLNPSYSSSSSEKYNGNWSWCPDKDTQCKTFVNSTMD